ncbi:hypothetical protein L596_026832 [Steinernema carpocapsae]|nr:hypothetical protein L596_026832 [Steinernema carpocapsae]
MPLLRAYTTTACNPKDRPRAVSLITGAIATGTTVGPALQLLFTPLSYPGWVIFPNFSVSMYTACAYVSCIMNAISFFTLKFFFDESYAGLHKENAVKPADSDEETVNLVKLPKFDRWAAIICLFTRFAQRLVFTNIEIIGSPYAMTVFGFTNQRTVLIGSVAQTGLGAIAVIIFMSFLIFKLNRYMKYRVCTVTALSLLLSFLVISFPWWFLPGKIQTYTNEDQANTTEELTGCNVDKLDWCETTTRVNPWLYYISFMVCVGIGYPVFDISINTIYGKILGPRRQGFMQGLLQVSAGLSSIVGPIMIGAMYGPVGPKGIWGFQIVILVVTLILWAIFRNRMVGLKVPEAAPKVVADVKEQSEKTDIVVEKC